MTLDPSQRMDDNYNNEAAYGMTEYELDILQDDAKRLKAIAKQFLELVAELEKLPQNGTVDFACEIVAMEQSLHDIMLCEQSRISKYVECQLPESKYLNNWNVKCKIALQNKQASGAVI